MAAILSSQRYISKELTHFVGRSLIEEDQYQLLVKILTTGWLTHFPHDPKQGSGAMMFKSWESLCDNGMFLPQVICFCDIPINDLKIHMNKYSKIGISFLKSFLVKNGANPVFYIAKNSIVKSPSLFDKNEYNEIKVEITRCNYFDIMSKEMHNIFIKLINSMIPQRKITEPSGDLIESFDVWTMFLNYHIFSFVKFFDDSATDEDHDNFYMEREWRIIGNLMFNLEDTYRVILPMGYINRFRKDVPEYIGQITYSD